MMMLPVSVSVCVSLLTAVAPPCVAQSLNLSQKHLCFRPIHVAVSGPLPVSQQLAISETEQLYHAKESLHLPVSF